MTRVYRFATIVVGLIAAACVPPKPAQLAPKGVASAKAAAEAAQVAARALAADGFEITLSDASAGIVTAKRVKAKDGNSAFVVCRFAHRSIAETNMETTITITVSAKPEATGSSVIVTNAVRATFPSLQASIYTATPPSDDDCASTGLAEEHVLRALGSGMTSA
jgi:hypothetical protein